VKSKTGLVTGLTILLMVTSGISVVLATEEIGEQEEIDCQVCHADLDQSVETLTDQGLYYQYMKSLAGYERVLERFNTCSYCHVDKAGSPALTAEGHRFQWMMEDMVGLRAWLDESHPRPAEKENNNRE